MSRLKKTIYIFNDGQLKRKDNTLYFETEAGKKYLPVEDVGEIMAFGEVTINKKFLEFASQKEIIVHYFSHYGYYMGTFYPREHLNSGFMILKQAEHYMDQAKRMAIAQQFVSGAARNIRQVLRYYNNRVGGLTETLNIIDRFIMTLDDINDINRLMAVEGNIRDHYYKVFDKITRNPDFPFEERTRRPPRNQLNTLISFGNSLMYTIALSEIYKTHLDPRIGFLHATNFRRFTLNLDLAEIFKPIIVDRVIFSVLGKKMITINDFESAGDGIIMKERAKKIFIQELDAKLKTTIKHKRIGRPVSYRRIIRLELYKLEKHLIGEETYEPFIAGW
ncbi:CRISPR-associated protein, Cas1 family [Desulfallas thermosapovorans DSM 6562]|uniref:CRISPR-associated endonuclease Cas1 n=1 Tax=Desulfallas thermosapovorans DSM 6562 TaxID=1121431 RepID=A0A5S4ZNB0_9FIRM|nr:CRISPR-associated protein, Cas1 family [Desulfallas thermosapovorans DSM 6562]